MLAGGISFSVAGRTPTAGIGLAIAHPIGGNPTTAVELNQAALVEHLFQLLTTSLHAGFHAGQGKSETFRGSPLCETVEFYQRHRVTIVVGQPIQHRTETGSQLRTNLAGHVGRG